MDTESAEKYLTSKLLCQLGQPFTLTHLTSILFHITQMSSATPVPVNAAIRAVAFLLKKQIVCEIAEAAARNLAEDLTSRLTDTLTTRLVDHTIAALAPQVATVHAASESLAKTAQKTEDSLLVTLDKAERLHRIAREERTEQEGGVSIAAERLEEAADALYSSVEDCQNALKILTPSLDATQDHINQLSSQLSSIPTSSQALPTQTNQATQRSYSSVVTTHLPPTVDQAVGRAAIRARQILLDPKPGVSLFPSGSSNKNIATRLREAINNIRDANTPDGNIKAITALRNGGVIVELESEDLAAWLRTPEAKARLEGQFDSTVSFRTRTYTLVLEYLPIHLQIYDENFLDGITNENQLPPDSLTSIRWIKPPTRRSQEQRKAFALLQVADAPTANNILRDGICVDNERISVRKDRKEPIRCAKCQRYGHIARNCSDESDTCGTCGEQHRSSSCNAYRTTRCVNCRNSNHTSWSRKCPEFIRRCEILDERYPENKMPYFPTEAAWTHIINPSRPSRPISTPAPTTPSPTHLPTHQYPSRTNHPLRQTTLNLLRPTTPTSTSPAPSTPYFSQPNSPAHLPSADEIMKELYPPIEPDPAVDSPPEPSAPLDSAPTSPSPNV
jgi:hypothetical protein